MILWRWIRKVLFFFDAEFIHHCTLRLIQRTHSLSPSLVQWVSGSTPQSSALPLKVLGMTFQNPLGLAAGLDKNGELLRILPELGFGFGEVGTITPRGQIGNPQPRLFRDAQSQSLFNLMGFNNDGADIIAKRVERARAHLPEFFRVGINIGKNKDTPLEESYSDYAQVAKIFTHLADYFVVNVSSPNTPGLRSLQHVEMLKPIILETQEAIIRANSTKNVPLLLKLSPELDKRDLESIFHAATEWKIHGFVLTNTLAGSFVTPQGKQLTGGWSGGKLTSKSSEVLANAKSLTSLPIISVGGIMNEEDALARLSLGADLIQIYSGWIFQGPRFPKRILAQLKSAAFSGK